ncbi:MarR family winged helix-turn-helix transcriptional regulator [Pedobacter sp. FW305-3-2-15-E-R2A2]|uniref:MarR family winged helix-turn-helix transcriptional regulator n=1 Tax=Pedobacter sp. FW305-3-2-15-E-R2A2 TaxID=3140251 RepID=UPI0031409C91
MKPVVELITAWADYESKNPAASVAEFCSHYLLNSKGLTDDTPVEVPASDSDAQLASLINQLNAIHVIYAKALLKEIPGIELEWFYFMKEIDQQKEARKSDIVSAVFFEQSTGIDILNRIKKAGLIQERNDPMDKRARLVKLSPQGEKILINLRDLLSKADHMLYQDLAGSNKKMLINLLSDTGKKHNTLISENRHKHLEELITGHQQEKK